MQSNPFVVPLTKNPVIEMKVIPGHYTTNHFHLSHYLDLNNLKTNVSVAQDVAVELSLPYLTSTLVDTIVCMEGTEVIGAYLAGELIDEGTSVINAGKEIHVVVPMINVDRKLMFQNDKQEFIKNKNVVLLLSSISSGLTMIHALECINYYGGKLVGISALFNAYPEEPDQEINSMFTTEDIPDYQIYNPSECPMCTKGEKLDAIIVHDGYSEIKKT
ncbi:MAG: hypothetical protein GX783_02315 [Clostridiales bacterium]|nr:hypothetical protein [Clostridiales bacterium]